MSGHRRPGHSGAKSATTGLLRRNISLYSIITSSAWPSRGTALVKLVDRRHQIADQQQFGAAGVDGVRANDDCIGLLLAQGGERIVNFRFGSKGKSIC